MKKRYTKLIVLIITIIIILLVILGFNFYQKQLREDTKPIIKHEDIVEEITNETPSVDYQEELNKLRVQYNNNDIVGTLTIENTSFNEIVMQYTDNDYYLEHTVYHEKNWRGQTFLDYRVDINNSKKLIIYGHNSPNYSLPFEIFENYHDNNYLKEHRYLYLQTDKEIKVYEIFSVYVEVKDWSYYNKMTFINDEEYYNHILKLKNNSFYDTGINITKDDEILIIQTCSTHKDYTNYENKFLLIIGKKVKGFDN